MSSYNIALNFEDGVTRFVTCKAGEKVLDAAFRAKINLPMDCSDGVCGTCKCRAESGSYDLGDDYIEDALTEDEKGIVRGLPRDLPPQVFLRPTALTSPGAAYASRREHRAAVPPRRGPARGAPVDEE